MTFATIIGLKNTDHKKASTFQFTTQKSPKITLYQINLGQKTKLKKTELVKIVSVLRKGEKINEFQFIWEVYRQKLSNLVTNDQNNAKKGRERPKTVKNRPKLHWNVAIVQIRPQKRLKTARNEPTTPNIVRVRVRLSSYRMSSKKTSLRKTTFYTKI